MFMQMFGREATKILDYVECFPNGAGKGKKMTKECQAAGLEGFPTWFINGKVFPWKFVVFTNTLCVPSVDHYHVCNFSTSLFV
jgi:hypothetical protein